MGASEAVSVDDGLATRSASEGRIYANYIQSSYPSRQIAVLWQNDQFGRDLFRGLQEGLGITANMIVGGYRHRCRHVDR